MRHGIPGDRVLALGVPVEARQRGQPKSDGGGAAVIDLADGASEGVYVTPGGSKRVEIVIGAPGEPLA
jgi:hypothetical protein